MHETNPSWLDVLASIEASLKQSLEQTPEYVVPPQTTRQRNILDCLDENWAYWRKHLDRIEAKALETEELLSAEAAALTECKSSMERIRSVLERWATQASFSSKQEPFEDTLQAKTGSSS